MFKSSGFLHMFQCRSLWPLLVLNECVIFFFFLFIYRCMGLLWRLASGGWFSCWNPIVAFLLCVVGLSLTNSPFQFSHDEHACLYLRIIIKKMSIILIINSKTAFFIPKRRFCWCHDRSCRNYWCCLCYILVYQKVIMYLQLLYVYK